MINMINLIKALYRLQKNRFSYFIKKELRKSYRKKDKENRNLKE